MPPQGSASSGSPHLLASPKCGRRENWVVVHRAGSLSPDLPCPTPSEVSLDSLETEMGPRVMLQTPDPADSETTESNLDTY